MSFFDEADEPRTASRDAPRRRRPSGTGRGPSGTGRRPPGGQPSVQRRRGLAAGVLLVLVILIALLVHGCQVSAANSALKDYTNSVSSLIQQSDGTGARLFGVLASGGGQGNASNLQNQINQTRIDANTQLTRARGMDVPDPVKAADQNLLLALRMRLDGITNIAADIQPALGHTTSKDAIYSIAGEMARFYASDILYKDYAAPAIAGALHAAGIVVGANGESIAGGQFVPNVQWLTPSFIAGELSVSLPGAGGKTKVAPGLHGHVLNSVSVAGTTLQTGSPNTIPASPPPTFTLSFTNGGTNNETNVMCKVTVTGTGTTGQKLVGETFAGQTATCQVTLSSKPAAGTYTVVATVEPVPGEKNKSNNSLSFPVAFQ